MQRLDCPEWFAELLARRGVESEEEAAAYLDPSVDGLHDPFLLAGMEEAVERLERAAEGGEKVAIVGDYDVDGVSATAMLVAVFRSVGIEPVPILPHRMIDGYGFQPVHVDRARDAGCGLVVTADCGTSSGPAAEKALAEGVDVIVTDHHLPGEPLPAGVVLINPKQEDCSYPFADLCGAGLAYKLCAALAGRRGRSIPAERLLQIAALGTISDLVPLRDENRTIAALGLAALPGTRSLGLRALFHHARLSPPFRSSDVGFRIGPRLNAAGRMDSPDPALELLLTRDPLRAQELAERLERVNGERRDAETRVVTEALEQLEEAADEPFLVAASPAWHRGVVGIAAGRVARELRRPTLLLSVDGDSATGSGRSVTGIDLHSFLVEWSSRYERFGGHSAAVGLTVTLAELEALRQEWAEAAAAWDTDLFRRRLRYDRELSAGELTVDLTRQLARLEPFGIGNPEPLFRLGPLSPAAPPRRFGRNHLEITARDAAGGQARVLAWGWDDGRAELFEGPFEVLGHPELDSYSGGARLRLRDARSADSTAVSSNAAPQHGEA